MAYYDEAFDDLDMGIDETTALSNVRDPEPCKHADIAAEEYDGGRCAETGYDDSGVRFTCLDCGEAWEGAEIRQLEAFQGAECVRCGSSRETVAGDRLHVNRAAVCCGVAA